MITTTTSAASAVVYSATVADGDGELTWSYLYEVMGDGSIVVNGKNRLIPTGPVVAPQNELEARRLLELYLYDSSTFYSPDDGDGPWEE